MFDAQVVDVVDHVGAGVSFDLLAGVGGAQAHLLSDIIQRDILIVVVADPLQNFLYADILFVLQLVIHHAGGGLRVGDNAISHIMH